MEKKFYLICLFLLITLFPLKIGVNRTSLSYLYFIDSKGIHRLDTTSNEKKVIFNTVGIYQVSLSLSPSDTVIALLVTKEGVTLPGEHDYSVLPRNSVIFITPEGKEIAKLEEDVREFSWSPDGEEIAYITGTYYEGGVGFKTTGVYIFDLKDGSKNQIVKEFTHPTIKDYEGGGYDLNWAVHDSNIYIQEFDYLGGNYMYNSKTGRTEKVPYKGVHFSPDGNYYLALPSEDFPRLYVSTNNREITEQVKLKIGYLPQSWMVDQKHHMLVEKVDFEPSFEDTVKQGKPKVMVKGERKIRLKTFFIYDVEKDQIIKEWIEKPEK